MYIGITTDYEKRKKQHFKQLEGNYHTNYKMQKDYNIYGEKSFTFEVIEEFDGDEKEAYNKEYELIQKTHATKYYNILEGGHLNPVYSPQCIQKLKESHQKKYDNILQYNFDGHHFQLLNTFGSIRDAEKMTNSDFRAIQNSLKTTQSHHNFYWVKESEKLQWLNKFLDRHKCCVAKINEENNQDW